MENRADSSHGPTSKHDFWSHPGPGTYKAHVAEAGPLQQRCQAHVRDFGGAICCYEHI